VIREKAGGPETILRKPAEKARQGAVAGGLIRAAVGVDFNVILRFG